MQLLLLQLLTLVLEQAHVVVDKVEVVPRCDMVDPALALGHARIDVLERAVDEHKRVDDRVAVRRRLRDIRVGHGEEIGRAVRGHVQVELVRELLAHLVVGLQRPVAEPVEHAAVEQSGRRRRAAAQAALRRIHREDDVQVAHHLRREPLVQLVGRVEHEALALRALLALRHQRAVLVAIKQPGHFAVGQQRVHALEETRVEDVAFVQDERDLLASRARATQQAAQVLVKVLHRVPVVHLDLVDRQPVQPRDKARQRRLARARNTNQQQVALDLLEHAVDAQHVLQEVIEQHQRHVKLLLVEHAQARADVLAQRLLLNGHIVLGQPVGEQDRALERHGHVDRGEGLLRNRVEQRAGPLPLIG
eukprot:Unigene4815_Nuclearia_a/m.14725 Unigene4815_Nuclearia_a/g.14725  ORF Unigene4815_Nuclearia_a/g.14725 Unigene4815_Nuclearia_a/m.14725 type:complete len:362 (+) Unigene4815_Nuclearia_a:2868-3953(+)